MPGVAGCRSPPTKFQERGCQADKDIGPRGNPAAPSTSPVDSTLPYPWARVHSSSSSLSWPEAQLSYSALSLSLSLCHLRSLRRSCCDKCAALRTWFLRICTFSLSSFWRRFSLWASSSSLSSFLERSHSCWYPGDSRYCAHSFSKLSSIADGCFSNARARFLFMHSCCRNAVKAPLRASRAFFLLARVFC